MAKRIAYHRTLTRQESLLGVFLALLIPALSAGMALPALTASMLFQ